MFTGKKSLLISTLYPFIVDNLQVSLFIRTKYGYILDKFPDAIITENTEYVKLCLDILFFHYFCDLCKTLS